MLNNNIKRKLNASFFLLILLSSSVNGLITLNQPDMNQKGLNVETIIPFLSDLYHIEANNCIETQQMPIQNAKETERLFFAHLKGICLPTSQDIDLVIKSPKNGKNEVERLKQIQDSDLSKINTSPLSAILELNLPLETYLIPTKNTYFILMTKAKGESLLKIFNERNQSERHEAYEAFGKALASLHLYYIDTLTYPKNSNEIKDINDFYKSYTQNDTHWENIYYDFMTKKIIFIDNESFADSLKRKRAPKKDLFKPSLGSMKNIKCTIADFNQKICTQGIDIITVFLKNYLHSYPKERQNLLKHYIQKLLLNTEEAQKILDESNPEIRKNFEIMLKGL